MKLFFTVVLGLSAVSNLAYGDCPLPSNNENQLEEAFLAQAFDLTQFSELTRDEETLKSALARAKSMLENATAQRLASNLERLFGQPQTNADRKSFIQDFVILNNNLTYKSIPLTDVEYFSLQSYTTEDYRRVNPALASQRASAAQCAYRDLLNHTLKKVPVFSGVVKRGFVLNTKTLSKMQPGQFVSFPYFFSTTKDLQLRKFEFRHRFLIHSKTGRDISTLSANPSEAEVLFATDTKFRVDAVKQNVDLNGSIAEVEIELSEI